MGNHFPINILAFLILKYILFRDLVTELGVVGPLAVARRKVAW